MCECIIDFCQMNMISVAIFVTLREYSPDRCLSHICINCICQYKQSASLSEMMSHARVLSYQYRKKGGERSVRRACLPVYAIENKPPAIVKNNTLAAAIQIAPCIGIVTTYEIIAPIPTKFPASKHRNEIIVQVDTIISTNLP